MASSNGDSPSPPDNGSRPESIPVIDLRLLSQSELYALSLCSSAASYPRRCDDLVIPKIDASVFNESAGSRKQTYSRIRLSPPKSESSIADGSPSPQLRDDPERAEDSRIISLLKDFMNGKASVPGRVQSNDPVPQLPKMDEVQNVINVPNVVDVVKKRGRGRPRKNENCLAVKVPNAVNVWKKRGRGRPPKNENAAVNNVVKKRGRGRPPKNEDRLAVVNVVNAVNDVKKRGRERPKEYENPLEVVIVPNVVNVLKRGKGMPPKIENRLAVVNNVVKKRGRGRPPKIENRLAVVNNVVKKRGRGRPPKYENRLTVVEPVVEMLAVAMVDKTEATRDDDIVYANAVNMDTNILNRDSNCELGGSVRSRRTREDGHRFRHRRNCC